MLGDRRKKFFLALAVVTILINQTAGAGDGNYTCSCSLISSVANSTVGNDLANTTVADIVESNDIPPNPPATANLPDAGWTVLQLGTLFVTIIFVTACICVLRGTASLPRPARRLLLVIDG